MNRFRLSVILLFVGICTYSARAVVDDGREVLLDFTQSDKIRTVATWSDSKYLTLTAEGLGWDGKPNESRDVTIETLKPTAVGWSWHPATAVHIEAEAVPAGSFRFGKTSIGWPSTAGTLYARYSSDGKQWSTWQALNLRKPRNREKPRLRFHGTLQVPGKARQRYTRYLKEFAGTERPMGVDEEAAVRWILDKEPTFFEHNLPFIGYVEFLWEKRIRGDQRLKQLRIHLSYSRGGRARIPEGHDLDTRWRLKAPQEQHEPARQPRDAVPPPKPILPRERKRG